MNSEELQASYADFAQNLMSGMSESQIENIMNQADTLGREMVRQQFDLLGAEIHPVNVEKGFWEEPVMMDKYAAKLALVHSEVTEVLEALRKNQGSDKVTEEFADIFIRSLDLYATLVEAGEADPNLYGVMLDKLEVNKNRPAKHGNRWG